MNRAVRLCWLLAIAACQPLPHPFAGDRPSTSLLTLRDLKSVSIGPIEGDPPATAAKLRDAVAKSLQTHDIPASDTTASETSYRLNGRIGETPPAAGKAKLTVHWQLRDAGGKLIGEREQGIEAATGDWTAGADKPVGELADASAETLAPLLSDEPTGGHTVAELLGSDAGGGKGAAVAEAGRTRVSIGRVGGAPGDGDHSLANAVAAVLKRQDLDIITDAKAQADLRLEAQVTVTPAAGSQQHVKIVWHLRRADGSEIGTVGQENDVPKGLLDAAWGDLAYTVATAAESGLLELLSRAGPPPPKKS